MIKEIKNIIEQLDNGCSSLNERFETVNNTIIKINDKEYNGIFYDIFDKYEYNKVKKYILKIKDIVKEKSLDEQIIIDEGVMLINRKTGDVTYTRNPVKFNKIRYVEQWKEINNTDDLYYADVKEKHIAKLENGNPEVYEKLLAASKEKGVGFRELINPDSEHYIGNIDFGETYVYVKNSMCPGLSYMDKDMDIYGNKLIPDINYMVKDEESVFAVIAILFLKQ